MERDLKIMFEIYRTIYEIFGEKDLETIKDLIIEKIEE